MIDSTLLDALYAIDPSSLNNDEWVRVGMALKEEGIDFEEWNSWSARDQRPGHGYPGAHECKKRWDSFKRHDVKGGTLIDMAKSYGWVPPIKGNPILWDGLIDFGEEEPVSREWKPEDDMIKYLEAVFEPDEKPFIVTDSYFNEKEQKWKPNQKKGTNRYTRDELVQILRKQSFEDAISTYNHEAGMWVGVNPVSGGQNIRENVVAFRHVLVESDEMAVQDQIAAIESLNLPVTTLTSSGNKSAHALVRVDAKDEEEYTKRVKEIYAKLEDGGFKVDQQNKNPNRLTRIAGAYRRESRQYLIKTHLGPANFERWKVGGKGINIYKFDRKKVRPKRDVIINGVAKAGDIVLITAPSKAGKTVLCMELAACVAEGGIWCGHSCKKGKALYVNFEVDDDEFNERAMRVYEKAFPSHEPENLDFVTLRGEAGEFADLLGDLTAAIKNGGYALTVIDPLYMLNDGDENSAHDMTVLFNTFVRLAADTKTVIVIVHHHSKGMQGAKNSMDRGSGSGVFGRAPDAIIDLYGLYISNSIKPKVEEMFGEEDVTAWEMSYTLRYWPFHQPKRLFYCYPQHIIDDTGLLNGAEYANEYKQRNLDRKNENDDSKKAKFENAVKQLEEKNGFAYKDDLAKILDVTEKTIQNWADKYGYKLISDSTLKRRYITKIE